MRGRNRASSVAIAVVALAGGRLAHAQSAPSIRVTVVDSSTRQPIPNAQILVGGAARGQTDASGHLVVRSAPTGTVTVRVQRIGFRPQQRQVVVSTGVAEVEIALGTQAAVLSDVVVVGYGTRSRAEVSSAVPQVEGETLRNTPVAGVDAALQGKAAGVQVVQNAGNPGNGITVRVRGAASIRRATSRSTSIDGIPLSQDNQSQIGFGGQGLTAVTGLNPDEIERIDVLKDAAAAAIYGSRASNGVILITTKRGRASAPRFSFNAYYGQQSRDAQDRPAERSRLRRLHERGEHERRRARPVRRDDRCQHDWQIACCAPRRCRTSTSRRGRRRSLLVPALRLALRAGRHRHRQRLQPRRRARELRRHGDAEADAALVAGALARAQRPHAKRQYHRGRVGERAGQPAERPGLGPDDDFSSSNDGLAYANPLAIASLNRRRQHAARARQRRGGLPARSRARDRPLRATSIRSRGARVPVAARHRRLVGGVGRHGAQGNEQRHQVRRRGLRDADALRSDAQ